MQTTTTRRAPRACKAAKPVYPELPETSHPGFWLAAFLRDCAELEAIEKLHSKLFSRKLDQITQFAMSGALRNAGDDARRTAKHVVASGLLPFAHAHTTYFAQEGGAA